MDHPLHAKVKSQSLFPHRHARHLGHPGGGTDKVTDSLVADKANAR